MSILSSISQLFNNLITNPPRNDIPIYDDIDYNGSIVKRVSETFFNEVVKPRLQPYPYINDLSLLNFRTFCGMESILDKYDLKNTNPVLKFQENFKIKFSNLGKLTYNAKIIFNYYLYLLNTTEQTLLSASELRDRLANSQTYEINGGFFFKGSRTRKKRKKKKNKRKTLKRNEKGRKWTDTGFPYRGITKSEAIKEFLRLKRLAKGNINPRSTVGNGLVDYGTEKARRKTKYRNRSFIEQWNNKTRRKKVTGFAKRLKKKDPNKSVLTAMRSAIDLQWGTVNTMRAAAAIQMYKKYKATRVLDFTAGWGARMIAAMALDIDYIGIDSNKSLKPGYDKLISLLKPYTKSKIRMIYKEAQKVNMSKLGKFDYVFTSPPYEYLEAYEHMKNYESSGKIKQPSSSQKIKMSDSAKFYDDFLVPTLKNAYKNLPVGKYICLNMPDIMYDKIKKRWKGITKKEAYNIVKRTGGKWGSENRRGKELIFCWKKR